MDIIRTAEVLAAALAANPNADLSIDATAELRLTINTGRPILRLFGRTVLRLTARESSQPHVEARESSQPHVEAWESSQPHVVARESSQPHVEAWGSSQPHVVARESSQPHVEARESSQPHVVARGSSQPHVEASAYAMVSLRGKGIVAKATANVALLLAGGAKARGGKQTRIQIRDAKEWCDYYGVPVKRGVVVLYKALDERFITSRGFSYTPGTVPVAPDWDGGVVECGGGLHFSPSPTMAMEFEPSAKRFVGCPIKLTDIAVHPDGNYPQKVKARGCYAPVFEVDRHGKPLATPAPLERVG